MLIFSNYWSVVIVVFDKVLFLIPFGLLDDLEQKISSHTIVYIIGNL